MRLRTILKIVGILLVALIVAAVAFILNLDPNDHKDRITAMVEDATGRSLTFGGPIDLDIGSTTTLVVRDVSFSNAEWGSRPDMATVGLLELDVRLLPLLVGDLDIERIVLKDADVLIESTADGRSNLQFESDESESGSDGSGGMGFGVGQLRIENVRVTMIDGAANQTIVGKLDRAIAVPAEPGAPLDVDVDGEITLDQNIARIVLDGQIGSSKAILSGDQPVPIKLAGTVLGYDVVIDGGVRQPENPNGVDVRISVTGDGLKAIQPFVSTQLPKLGPVDISAHVTGAPEAPVVEDIRIAAARTVIAGKAEFGPGDTASYNLKATLDGQDLGLVSPYVGLPLENLGPLTGSINIVGDLETLRLEPNAVTVDRSKLSGSMTVGLKKLPPTVDYDVTLTVDGQTLDIVEPFVNVNLPALGPINGTIRAVGNQKKARIEVTDVKADSSTLSGQVTATNLDATPTVEYDVKLRADAQSLEILRPYVGGDVADLSQINGGLQAVGTLEKAKLTLDDVVIDNSRISGRADIDRSMPDITADYDFTLVATQQTLDILRPFLGVDIPAVGPVDLTASLKGNAKQAQFENLSLRFEDSQLSGNGQVDLTGDIPVVTGAFNSTKFDLTRFFPDTTVVEKPKLVTKEEAERDAKSEDGGPVFPSDPLPLELINTVKADLAVKIGEFLTPYGVYRDVDLRIVTSDGSLTVRPLSATYAESKISGNLSVDTGGGLPLFAMSFSGPKIAIGQVAQDFANLDVLQGTGSVNIAVNGSGHSVAEIMGSLNGHARVLMGQGRMRNEGLGYVSGVFSSIGEILGRKEWVVVECLANDFQIENGIATAKVGILDTEVISLTVSGDINLQQERYNLKVKPLPRGLDISLAVPVNVTGPLSDPGFRPDALGSLTKLGTIFGTVLFPPVALLGLTEMGGNSHPCVQFAKESESDAGATPVNPLEKGSSGGVLGAPGRILDGVGQGLKGVLGN